MTRRNLRALLRMLDEHPRVIRVVETSDHIEIQLSPGGPTVRVSAEQAENAKPDKDDEPEETPDEWLRRQYQKPDGT